MSNSLWTDGQLKEIVARKAKGQQWKSIAAAMKSMYGLDVSAEAVRSAYRRHEHLFEVDGSVTDIKALKDVARLRRTNSMANRENRKILDYLNAMDDIATELKEAFKSAKIEAPKREKVTKSATKTDMTMELMLTDLHIGKLASNFNLDIARRRLRKYVDVVISEYRRYSLSFNIEQFVVFLGGDLIENSILHGAESLAGSEFQNPEQIRWCIQLLYSEVLLSLYQLGVPIHVICVPGNHDRTESYKTYQDPGKNSFSWIIHQSLRMLAEQAKLKSLSWDIPDGVFTTYNIYGTEILYEHLHLLKAFTKKGFADHLRDRSNQTGKFLRGLRGGHIHEYTCLDQGVAIVNASLCGQDSYAEASGYTSRAGQVLNLYCRTNHRDNSFYKSFLIQLDEVK